MNDTAVRRILALHDLSGFGHTSLMAVIPIMYRLGIRVCAFPTAVLSANTDYPRPRWVDMSAHLESFTAHWKELGLRFDAIYSGFLSSAEQAQQIGDSIQTLRGAGTLVLVDPVMGDNGALYSCFAKDIIPAMRGLVSRADVITPNYTEAALLAGADPAANPDPAKLIDWCRSIAEGGPQDIVITSVPAPDNASLEVRYYNSAEDTLAVYPYLQRSGEHPGAGDCFSTFVLAGIVNGFSVASSIQAAVEIMSLAIGLGVSSGADWREGIALESLLQTDLHSHYQN